MQHLLGDNNPSNVSRQLIKDYLFTGFIALLFLLLLFVAALVVVFVFGPDGPIPLLVTPLGQPLLIGMFTAFLVTIWIILGSGGLQLFWYTPGGYVGGPLVFAPIAALAVSAVFGVTASRLATSFIYGAVALAFNGIPASVATSLIVVRAADKIAEKERRRLDRGAKELSDYWASDHFTQSERNGPYLATLLKELLADQASRQAQRNAALEHFRTPLSRAERYRDIIVLVLIGAFLVFLFATPPFRLFPTLLAFEIIGATYYAILRSCELKGARTMVPLAAIGIILFIVTYNMIATATELLYLNSLG
jgi:hypothetical protein